MGGKLAHPGCLICCVMGDRQDTRMAFCTHMWRKMKSPDRGIASFSRELASRAWLNTPHASSVPSKANVRSGYVILAHWGCVGARVYARVCAWECVQVYVWYVNKRVWVYVVWVVLRVHMCVPECVCVCCMCTWMYMHLGLFICHEKQPSYYILLFLNWP